jgi:hypothetical protein
MGENVELKVSLDELGKLTKDELNENFKCPFGMFCDAHSLPLN